MNVTKKIAITTLFCLSGSVAVAAGVSTDSAETRVTLAIETGIAIGNLQDIPVIEADNGTLWGRSNYCVARTGAGGESGNGLGYAILARGDNSLTDFVLSQDDSNDDIAYSVHVAQEAVNNVAATGDSKALVPGIPHNGFTTTDSNVDGCNNDAIVNNNSTVWIGVAEESIKDMGAGIYEDTLTLTVAPI